MAADRWRGPAELLDFYHASQHLWELAPAPQRGDEARAGAWGEPRLHQLRHGQERRDLTEIAALSAPRGPRGAIERHKQEYFAGHEQRMHYERVAARARRLAAVRWNRPAVSANVAAHGRDSSGQHWGCVILPRSKKPVTTGTEMIFGSPTSAGSVKMHPPRILPALHDCPPRYTASVKRIAPSVFLPTVLSVLGRQQLQRGEPGVLPAFAAESTVFAVPSGSQLKK